MNPDFSTPNGKDWITKRLPEKFTKEQLADFITSIQDKLEIISVVDIWLYLNDAINLHDALYEFIKERGRG